MNPVPSRVGATKRSSISWRVRARTVVSASSATPLCPTQRSSSSISWRVRARTVVSAASATPLCPLPTSKSCACCHRGASLEVCHVQGLVPVRRGRLQTLAGRGLAPKDAAPSSLFLSVSKRRSRQFRALSSSCCPLVGRGLAPKDAVLSCCAVLKPLFMCASARSLSLRQWQAHVLTRVLTCHMTCSQVVPRTAPFIFSEYWLQQSSVILTPVVICSRQLDCQRRCQDLVVLDERKPCLRLISSWPDSVSGSQVFQGQGCPVPCTYAGCRRLASSSGARLSSCSAPHQNGIRCRWHRDCHAGSSRDCSSLCSSAMAR